MRNNLGAIFMNFIFTLLCCLLLSRAFADVIGDVEYRMPKDTKEWIVGNELMDSSGKPSTIVYIPAGTVKTINKGEVSKPVAREFFSIATGGRYFDPNDTTLKEYLVSKAYPNMDVKYFTLEKTDDGLLYEWVVKDNGQEKVHGWGRLVPTPSGSANAMYQTENMSEIDKSRALWVPTLRGITAIPPQPTTTSPQLKAPPHS